MSHGYVDEWWDRYKNEEDKQKKEKMWEEREKWLKEYRERYPGPNGHILYDLDFIKKVGKIVGAVKKYGDKALIAFQNVDNKRGNKNV